MNNGEKEKKRPEGESNDGLLASLGSVSIASVALRAAAAVKAEAATNAAATNVVPEVPPNTEAQTKRQKRRSRIWWRDCHSKHLEATN